MSLQLLKNSIAVVETDTKIEPKTKKHGKSNKVLKPLKHTVPKEKTNLKTVHQQLKKKKSNQDKQLVRLRQLSKCSLKHNDAKKMFQHLGKMEKKKPKPKQESIFTEEDFKALDEYLDTLN